MRAPIYYGIGSRGIVEERHTRFQRQSATSGNWATKTRPPRPLWKDFAAAIIGGLIVLPPLCLYVAPVVVAFIRAAAEN